MFVKAYAKINLFLDVLSKRDDGYHDLNMVMLPVELHDSIEIETSPVLMDSFVTTDHIDLQVTKYNLINKTLKEMKKRYGFKQNFIIKVHKEIPISAGLGGGSSNAAAVIKAVKSLTKLKLSKEEEIDLGVSLGADVPYCLANVPAHVEGIGEKVTPIKMKKRYDVIIIKPSEGLSTKKVFEYSDTLILEHRDISGVIKALETGNDELLEASLFNSLEKPSITLVPEIQKVKDELKKAGFKMVLMSGSGSSVFALTTDHKLANAKYREFEKKGYEVYLTRTL